MTIAGTAAARRLTTAPANNPAILAGLVETAQAFRATFKQRILDLIADYDVLLAPATPCVAPSADDPRIMIDGVMTAARADLGIHTQPISFTGLPSLSVPLRRPGALPLGLQLIGKPGGEPALLRFAAMLEARGITGVTMPEYGVKVGVQGEV